MDMSNYTSCFPPAEYHHILAPKRMHWLGIPLCTEHHRGRTGIHLGKETFRKKYLHELDMYALLIKISKEKGFYKKQLTDLIEEFNIKNKKGIKIK
jgi:hypothetical protein